MAKKTNTTINGQDYYRVRAKIGTDSDGKAIMKAFYGKTKKEAETAKSDYLSNMSKNANYSNETIFIKLFDEWSEHIHKPSISESSYLTYQSPIDYYLRPSDLAQMRIVDIQGMHIQKLYNSIDAYTPVRFIDILLKMFFKYLYDNEIINKSPLRGVARPAKDKSREESEVFENFLTYSEIETLKSLGRSPAYFPYVFLIYTGLRRGELCALNTSDVDLKTRRISVNKSYSEVKKKGKDRFVLGPTKGRESRVVPIPDFLVPLIEHYIGNVRSIESTPFITNGLGEPIIPDKLYFDWKVLRKKVTSKNITVHGLRHTYCSRLCAKGVPMKTAADLMGHKNTKLVDEIYSHVQIEDKFQAVNNL